MAGHTPLARDLVNFALDLRRALRNLVADEDPDSVLSWAQSELLHDVRLHPGSTVNAVAERLHLAPNTISTLVRGLVERRLLERRPNPEDGRSVLLHLGEERSSRRARRADQRAARLAAALDGLSEPELATLESAAPILARLVAELGEQPLSPDSAPARAAMADQDGRGAHDRSATR